MEYLLSGTALVIALIALYFQIKDSKKKIPKFTGRIGKDCTDKNTAKFATFIFEKLNEIVFLDIYFDNEENYEVDEENKFYFHLYEDLETKLVGYSFQINIEKGDDFFYDSRPSAKRLVGHFKILGMSGPQHGFFTALMKPVKIEYVK
jgi:hypothetical protein